MIEIVGFIGEKGITDRGGLILEEKLIPRLFTQELVVVIVVAVRLPILEAEFGAHNRSHPFRARHGREDEAFEAAPCVELLHLIHCVG